jgi:hypothetical protein
MLARIDETQPPNGRSASRRIGKPTGYEIRLTGPADHSAREKVLQKS